MTMQHEQQDPDTRSYLPLLLPLLVLSLVMPLMIEHYESQQDYRWENMLRQQWHPPVEPGILPVTAREESPSLPALASAGEDVQEWKSLAAPVGIETPVSPPVEPAAAKTKPAVKPAAPAKKAAVPKKPESLKLRLPENPYHGALAKWEDEAPLPDLFAPKPVSPGRLELGGRLITDDDVQKKNPEADFLDTVKGAELNISIKTD